MTVRAFQRSVGTNTYAIDCSNVSTAALQIPGGGMALRIANGGTVAVAVHVAVESTLPAAVFPTNGNPQLVVVILPGVTEVFTAPADAYVRAITASGTATIYVTRGEGI